MNAFVFIILVFFIIGNEGFRLRQIPVKVTQRSISSTKSIGELKENKAFSFNKKYLPILSTVALGPLLFASKSFTLPFQSITPLLFLIAYTPCLIWGLPWSRIGSWKSFRSYWHRIGGIGTLIIPLFFAVHERMTSQHVPLPIYLACQIMIWINVMMGALLIPSRIPAYDIPTLRAFAVGVLLALSFSSMSLFYRFGALQQYTIIGKILAVVAGYGVVYAWSDALQHVYRYCRGDYKPTIGRKWYLPFERSSLKDVFFTNIIKQPTQEAMEASVSPSNIVTVTTTFLTAIFATIAMLQGRYLLSGAEGMQKMVTTYPEIVRWSCYEALLAVVANNFGTFAGTLVLQNRVPQPLAGTFNAVGLLIPVLHVIAFILGNPNGIGDLMKTSIMRL
jgi:hypothetical protein